MGRSRVVMGGQIQGGDGWADSPKVNLDSGVRDELLPRIRHARL